MSRVVVLCVLLVVLLAACVPGANPSQSEPSPDDGVAGFWRGLWHGIIVPFTFIVSLFTDDVDPYEVHNNGNWYNFGFVLGAGVFLGGSGTAGGRRRR